MSATREEVAKIAALARIRMDEAALDRMVPEFNAILGFVEQLGEVDTAQVEPMTGSRAAATDGSDIAKRRRSLGNVCFKGLKGSEVKQKGD